jgi:hypothetical protein
VGAGYAPDMTTTPNEPVADPNVVPAGDPVAPGEPPPEAEPNPETDPDLPPPPDGGDVRP